MNRRNFLQLLGLTGLASLLPFSLAKRDKWQTRTLNTTTGDNSFMRLTVSEIYLEPGVYDVSAVSRVKQGKCILFFKDPVENVYLGGTSHRYTLKGNQFYQIEALMSKDWHEVQFDQINITKVG